MPHDFAAPKITCDGYVFLLTILCGSGLVIALTRPCAFALPVEDGKDDLSVSVLPVEQQHTPDPVISLMMQASEDNHSPSDHSQNGGEQGLLVIHI